MSVLKSLSNEQPTTFSNFFKVSNNEHNNNIRRTKINKPTIKTTTYGLKFKLNTNTNLPMTGIISKKYFLILISQQIFSWKNLKFANYIFINLFAMFLLLILYYVLITYYLLLILLF